ncbi:MAG TPA: UDP-N-acetylglucosamine 2-epimerase (non-hydrolyzing) [Anaerolineales bacterium]
MKIISIVGARPEFIQAMPVSRVLYPEHLEILVHTGQHYDYRMSQAFFEELDIPAPHYNLAVGSGSQARQAAQIITRLEKVLLQERPDLVIVRGDTNSTLAAVLAASKLHIPTAHIEAGERSFDRRMPEEINRVVADSLSDLHFCVSQAAVCHLAGEGITESVHLVGDVMLDAMLQVLPVSRRRSAILQKLGVQPHQFALVTVHRAANTDDPDRLDGIIRALNRVPETVVFPVHPRTAKALAQMGASLSENVRLIEPVGYLDMMMLEANARMIATDSGGVQREAYFLEIPCLTLRDETEWLDTVAAGWNLLVGADPERILDAWCSFQPPVAHPAIFGDGAAALRIAQVLNRGSIRFGEHSRKDSKELPGLIGIQLGCDA